MDEIDIFFDQLTKERDEFNLIKPLSIAEKIVEESENTFKSYSEEEKLRLNEEEELNKKIKHLEGQFLKYKNIKNHKLRHHNEARSKKRKEIKKKIIECKLRLQDINMERPNK